MDNDDLMKWIKEEAEETAKQICQQICCTFNIDVKAIIKEDRYMLHCFYQQVAANMFRESCISYLHWENEEDKSGIYASLTMGALLQSLYKEAVNDKKFEEFCDELYSKKG